MADDTTPKSPAIIIPTVRELGIKREGPRVNIVEGGRTILSLPYRAAAQLGRGLIESAKRAEAEDRAPEIARDQAILLRAGVPIGLSNDRKVLDEAGKLAAHDRDLRRFMPGGIKSQEHVGVPAVITKPPREEPEK